MAPGQFFPKCSHLVKLARIIVHEVIHGNCLVGNASQPRIMAVSVNKWVVRCFKDDIFRSRQPDILLPEQFTEVRNSADWNIVLVPLKPILRVDVPNSTECAKRGNTSKTTSCTRSAKILREVIKLHYLSADQHRHSTSRLRSRTTGRPVLFSGFPKRQVYSFIAIHKQTAVPWTKSENIRALPDQNTCEGDTNRESSY